MINGKKKGNRYELWIVDFFKRHGFDCATSRLMSRALDNAKSDIYGITPFHVQAKACERLPKSAHAILDEMPKDTNYRLLFHKVNRKGTTVTMPLEDFEDILKQLIITGSIKPTGNADIIDFMAENGVDL